MERASKVAFLPLPVQLVGDYLSGTGQNAAVAGGQRAAGRVRASRLR